MASVEPTPDETARAQRSAALVTASRNALWVGLGRVFREHHQQMQPRNVEPALVDVDEDDSPLPSPLPWASPPPTPPEEGEGHMAVEEETCPYHHAKDMARPPPTTPTFEPFGMQSTHSRNDDTNPMALRQEGVALHLQDAPDTTRGAVPVLADSGASHVLIRECDQHVLNNREYTGDQDVPYATLKAASGHRIKAVGKGTLHVGPIVLPAYIFKTVDLTSNLLGLAPFCDRDCTMTFTKTTVHIVHTLSNQVILTGHRPHGKGLWNVDLPPSNGDNEVIAPATPINQGIPGGQTQGVAHHMEQLDAGRYVRFVHAAFGYPCPTTFMKAVGAGFITGPKQFPRLTTKMVRRHMPNALATARGHLDKVRAG